MIFDTIPADFLTALFLIKAIVDNVILITSSDLMENVSIKMNFVGNMMTMDFVWNVLQNIFWAKRQISVNLENQVVIIMMKINVIVVISHSFLMEFAAKFMAAFN